MIMDISRKRRANSFKKRPRTLIKGQKRLSFSFDISNHVRPILLTPIARAARNVSIKARRIRFRSKSSVIEITPLPDKPTGRIRMPQEECENEELENYTKCDAESDKENYNIFEKLIPRSTVQLNPLKTNNKGFSTNYSSVSLNFDFEEVSSYTKDANDEVIISIVEPTAVNNANFWSVDESNVYECASLRAENLDKVRRELWTKAFAPKTKQEIFNNTFRIYSWLQEWIKKLSLQKPEEIKLKRKRSIMYDDDEDYDSAHSLLPNLLIIEGKSGCGKTSTVYCAAKELNINVLEFSCSDRRNAASFAKKFSGAIENCYVQSRNNADIRRMFSPKVATKSTSNYNFSIALIDDCDIVYANDENFWTSLRNMCDESKIPIILTCVNYEHVKNMLKLREREKETLHFVCPLTSRFTRYLRAWLAGYTKKLMPSKWLHKLVEEHRNNVRAVLNFLQFQIMGGGKLHDTTLIKNEPITLKSHLIRIKTLSELDSFFGKTPTGSVSWRSRLMPDLNYRSDFEPAYQPLKVDSEEFETCLEIMRLIDRFIFLGQLLPLLNKSWKFNLNEPIKPLKDAWMRSWPRAIYSWKSVGEDYMPCLAAIDEKFHAKMRSRFGNANLSSSGLSLSFSSTTSTRTRIKANRNQHPFDERDRATTLAIDMCERLRESISKYPFSRIYYNQYY